MRSHTANRVSLVRWSAARAVALAWLVGCSSPSNPDMLECWPGGGTPTPGAEVELGVGVEFTAVVADQEVQLVRGSQGGFHFEVHARIRGLTPGQAGDPRPGNPFTMFRVFTDEGVDASLQSCTFPLGYAAVGGGAFELPSGRLLRIDKGAEPELANRSARIQVEVLDADGRYAVDERRIFVLPADETTPGEDAGAPDAGVDAGPDAGE